jgi:hypothetical protein
VFLLFIRSLRFPTDEPIIDELTMSLTSAWRRSPKSDNWRLSTCDCICGAFSGSAARILPGGAVANALCLHYLAYHRAEVPAADLDAIRRMPIGAEVPARSEVEAPEYRASLNSMIFRLDGQVHEEVDAENEVVRWQYEMLLDNRASVAVHVTRMSFSLSLDATYSPDEVVEAGWTLGAGEVQRVPHAPVFRVAEFRRGRSQKIAEVLSVTSRKAVTWTFGGGYANGGALPLHFEIYKSD